LAGREVTAECHDGVRRGWLLELGFDGVVLEEAGGAPLALRPETVLHLEAAAEPPNRP
jgi:hypothetical protein